MAEERQEKPEITESTATAFVLLKDASGKQYVCRISDLRDPSQLTEEEKKRCYENVEEALRRQEGL
jgi:hypothetical protein